MAIYIQIKKLEDLGDTVIYEFGPPEGIIGKVVIVKATGEVMPLDFTGAGESVRQFYLPRVQRKLFLHFQRGEFPERTCWAS